MSCRSIQVTSEGSSLCLLDFNAFFLPQFREVLSYYFFKYPFSTLDRKSTRLNSSHSGESRATEIKGLSNSHEELKNALNEMQNKMETTTARIEEAEERIGELEDKIMETEEVEKKRDKKNPGVRGEN